MDFLSGQGDGGAKRASRLLATPRVRLDPRTLRGTFPSKLLMRIAEGDPFDLELRCELRLEERSVLMSLDRLFRRAIARCAFAAYRYDPAGAPVDDWLAGIVDQSIDELLEDDLFGQLKSTPIEKAEDYELFIEHLELAPELAREAYVAFNELPEEVRRVFCALAVSGLDLDALVAAGEGTREVLEERLAVAVDTLVAIQTRDREEDGA